MHLRKRRRRLCLLIFILIFVIFIYIFLRYQFSPIILEMSKTKVSNEASFSINRAIIRQIENHVIEYDRMIVLEKNVDGSIAAIKTNMAEVNRLQTLVLAMVDEEVLEMSISEIGIPLGNVFLPEIFSGKGPIIPVKVIAVSTADAEFVSKFSDAGINQTLHQILLTVTATMTVLTPMGTQNVTAVSNMIVAETVIIGTVPQTYMNIGQITR